MKKTRKENNSLKSCIVYLLLWLFSFTISLFFIIHIRKYYWFDLEIKYFFMIFTVFDLVILSAIFLIPAFKIFFGYFKGKVALKDKSKITNPYLYYRNLPNNYGIGVSSLLIDSAIENEKDIVAVILDLCARKYLKLEKKENNYELVVLNNIDDNLLANEKYILECIFNNSLINIDYRHWYDLCLKDGISLGLYKENAKIINKLNDAYQEVKIKEQKWDKIMNKIILCIFFISLFVALINYKMNIFDISESNIFNSILVFTILFFGTMMMFEIILMIQRMNILGKELEEESYKHTLNCEVKKTQKGLEEIYKLEAFKKFIKDFGNFTNRHLEEVILWDRYLSYAQLFGLTKEIMATGYTKLTSNNSFKIDDINNIKLNNLHILH